MTHNVFIDLETGGLEAEKNGITEVAAVGFTIDTDENGYPVIEPTGNEFRTLVKPEKWLTYSFGALSMQEGYRSLDKLLAEGRCENSVFWDLVKFCQGELGGVRANFIGRIWAHEAIFDWGFIHQMETRHHNLPNEFFFGKRCDWSCSKFLYRRLAALGVVPNMEEVHLESVARHYGIDFPVQHTALGDTKAALKCLEAIMRDEHAYYLKKPVEIIDMMIRFNRSQMADNPSLAVGWDVYRGAIDALQSLRKNITGETLPKE